MMSYIGKLLAVALLIGASVTVASAQSTAPDYAAWEKVANRAEVATEDGRASNAALEGLRSELAAWRTQFLAAQGGNGTRIATLENQIAALGPVPEGGAVEPIELSDRRRELISQLANLQAPQRRAVEAYSQADGLIKETAAIIRERQAARLLELDPTPLNPTLWPGAARTLWASLTNARAEVSSAWASEALQKRLRENLTGTLVFLVVAAVLLLRGRIWMVRLTARVQKTATGASARVRGFLVSFGQIILPVLGLFSLAAAVYSTELLGFRGQIVADGLMAIGTTFFVARWLALQLLPRTGPSPLHFEVPAPAARNLRNLGTGLAVVWAGNRLLSRLQEFDSYPAAAQVVLDFVLIALAGFLLFRFARSLRRCNLAARQEPDAAVGFRSRSVDTVARAMMLVGVAAPLAAAIGYLTAAAFAIFPAILSIGVLALLIIISGVIRDLYALVTGCDDQTAQGALVPVLVEFFVVISSIPLFALIWGARLSDLREIWVRFGEGVQLGDARISPGVFLTFAIIFVAGYMLTRLLQSTLSNSVLPKTSIDPGGQAAITSGVGYVGVFLAALVAISTAGIDLSSLAIVAGALSVGIGFGLQNIVSNFVSGIILLIERPITEGDWIEVGGYSGTVRDISVRSTRIETFDRTDVIIPNADLVSGAVTNYTRGNLVGRAVISVGAAYGSDTQKVQDILTEIAAAHPMVLLNPPPSVHLMNFGDDSLEYEIRAILRDVNFILSVKSEIRHEIARRFAEEGIEIPFAQRDVWLRNAEVLQAAAKPK